MRDFIVGIRLHTCDSDVDPREMTYTSDRHLVWVPAVSNLYDKESKDAFGL